MDGNGSCRHHRMGQGEMYIVESTYKAGWICITGRTRITMALDKVIDRPQIRIISGKIIT
jgi:stage III sporulation protein SpoIIIAA